MGEGKKAETMKLKEKTNQTARAAKEYDPDHVGVMGYLSLLFAVLFFSGIFSGSEGWMQILDFQSLIGSYGKICEYAASAGFVGTGGTGVREGFLQALNMAPVMIFSVAFIGCVDYLGGLKAAQKLLTPVLQFLMGVPGASALAMILNWQSSDGSAAAARTLYLTGRASDKELERLVAYEFVTAATIGVFFSNGAVLLPYLTCSTGVMLGMILLNKFIAGNLMRLYQLVFERNKPAQFISESEKVSISGESGAAAERKGLINAFMASARNGFQMWFNMLVPAMLFGYVVVRILDLSGLMDVIGVVFSPVMGIFGLPGEAATAIITAYMTLPAGCASAAAMVTSGVLTARQVTVLFPMMYAIASHLLYVGRVLGASGINTKKYPVYIGIGIVCAIIGGTVMNVILP